MKILLSSSTLNVTNGYGNITYELVSSLKKEGHEITLLLPQNDTFFEYDIEGVEIQRVLPEYVFRYKSKKILKYLFWNYTPEKRFDIVHSLFEFPYAPLLCRVAQKHNIPFVIGAQGTYGVKPLSQFPERFIMKRVYRAARAFHVPSEYTKKSINKEAGEEYNITIIHNGVNFDRFKNFEAKAVKPESLLNKKILLTVGELKSRKGQDLVIQALPEIVKKHPDVLYVLVGAPSWKEYLQNLAKKLGVLENVKFVGVLSGDDVVNYFYACDIYVHTPRIHNRFQFEGFGIVYLEAGACGKPSVGTDAGGIKDALVDDRTGLVAADENVQEISDFIIRLLDDENLRKRYGENARAYAREHDWSEITKQYIKLYQSII